MKQNNLRSRGYLPHFVPQGYIHTVRISQLDVVPPSLRETTTPEPYGSCLLADPVAAAIVENSLWFLNDTKAIRLHAYVIMPNHVHILAQFHTDLGDVCRRLKTFTNHQINRELGHSGKFWQRDYFDQLVENETAFSAAKLYIEQNPVRAGLCERKEEWRYSSAFRGET